MNRYPIWKYLLLLCIFGLGIVYALPNIYPPDPAVQISGSSASLIIDQKAVDKATAALSASGIEFFGVEFDEKNALIRLRNKSDQLVARSKIQDIFSSDQGSDYVVAVNLAPTTPQWLLNVGASPMKLGLDLAGGIHFLLEVDTPKVLLEELKSSETMLKRQVRTESLHGVKVRRMENGLVVESKTEDLRLRMSEIFRKELPNMDYQKSEKDGLFKIRATFKESFVREKEDYAVQQNLTTLRKRVNEIGVSEPLVQRQGRNRIVVQLPGIQDTARAKSIIGKTANLEFRLEANSKTLASQKEKFDRRNPEHQRQRGGAFLNKKPIVRGDSVINAQVGFDPETSQPMVSITLDNNGGSKMLRATNGNVGRAMGVLFIEFKTRQSKTTNEQGEEVIKFTQIPESKIISLATIQQALGARFQITGLDSPEEASELALLLRAGALAAPMGFVEERTIGPSLGAENIKMGVNSVQIGLALVLAFMFIYYRVFGLAANVALTVNMILLIGIMSMVGATLTLPGIAGIVLTVGMAVDANVLIFSRIKEELGNGVPNQTAIKSGFDRAFITILDANITTFIVAIILYAIGSGPVKGFAVTLAIGILTSMFTAIMVTRSVINMIYGNRSVKKLWI